METDIVFRNESGVAVTNSLLVAEVFGKNHKEVLRDIDTLIVTAQNCALTENQQITLMFQKTEYETQLNNGTGAVKKNPMFFMNKDGFTLLAMGYTGKKALAFKLRYIAAFNTMEQQLRQGISHSIGNLSRKQILGMALEAEREKERMEARLALAESKAADMQDVLSRIEALELRMKSAPQKEETKVVVPKVVRKGKVADDPKTIRKKYPDYMSAVDTLKWLRTQGIRIKNVEFYAFLRSNGLTSSDDSTYNLPTDMAVGNGWMIGALSGTYQKYEGRHYYTPYFSPQGRQHVLQLLRSVKTTVENSLFAIES